MSDILDKSKIGAPLYLLLVLGDIRVSKGLRISGIPKRQRPARN